MTEKITDQKLEKLRLEYVEGIEDAEGVRSYPTVDALCKSHNVSRATLYRKSVSQNWQQQRNQWQDVFNSERNRLRAEKFAKQGERLDSKALFIAQGVLSSLGRKVRTTLEAEENEIQELILSLTEMKDLTEAGLKAQKMGKLALGEAAEITKVTTDEHIPASLSRIIEELDELAASKSQGANVTIQ